MTIGSEALPDARSSDWLPSCHGFRVEAAGKRLGVVEDILYGDGRIPAALLVRGGLWGTRTSIVPVENVTEVVPRSKRVVLGDRTAADPRD
jgi:PRC-barrel domain